MKKQRTTYEQAIAIWTAHHGTEPTYTQITNSWHRYANEWKHFDGYADWLYYNG